ncbi:protein POLR1D-like [Thrips palmi]|uniref:Protein POLR1D-like n=1 Tax=Thrips palmi TaxID=161013 RepID=A0A6P8Y5D9_THRPL|nr:protein POLR1D-like [Thrips palmi]
MDDEELERLAAEELLKEAKQGAARAVVHGALGWKKDHAPRPNKRFLTTTLANTMQHNHRRSRSRSTSPYHKYNRSRRGNSSHESTHRDKHRHRSRERHRDDRESRRDKSAKKERSEVKHSSKKHSKDKEKDERKSHRSKRGHSH